MTIAEFEPVILVPMDALNLWNLPLKKSFVATDADAMGSFVTCLRNIRVSFQSSSALGSPDLQGWQAYKYLLSAICGLQSPILGETEVFGQFKSQSKNFPIALQKLVGQLLTDAKLIRREHLKGFGGGSYGSVAREELKGSEQIVMVGAGHLAQEIHPWLSKVSKKIWVSSRKNKPFPAPDSGKTEMAPLASIKNISCDLVIAAPISNQDLQRWLQDNQIQVRRVVDFRHVSVGEFPGALTLEKIFERLNRNQNDREKIKSAAIASIDSLLIKHQNRTDLRPLGWEDLCV